MEVNYEQVSDNVSDIDIKRTHKAIALFNRLTFASLITLS